MSQQPMRGTRLGSESFEVDTNKNLSPRKVCLYRCSNDHISEMIFSADAEIPVAWGCKSCALEGALLDESGKQAFETEAPKVPRTHFEMLLERRSREELEELLSERLGELKARRARGQADATNS
ncbi:MAG: RNA polymerase-binding protein RbpA [Rhodoluna sp.]|nr:RNA polymerase-binding protein RbpA [Rhodoluna sp.]